MSNLMQGLCSDKDIFNGSKVGHFPHSVLSATWLLRLFVTEVKPREIRHSGKSECNVVFPPKNGFNPM